MKGTLLSLDSQWTVGEQIGSGGFGLVYEAWSGEESAAVKFVPKAGGDRELLFVDLDGARNVVPIIDYGEHNDYWVLVMPRADLSLRDLLDKSGKLALGEVLDVRTMQCWPALRSTSIVALVDFPVLGIARRILCLPGVSENVLVRKGQMDPISASSTRTL